MKNPIITSVVLRAIEQSVCDLGQFSHDEWLQLQRAVRHGVLSKGKGGPFLVLKTVYARPGFDFARDRMEGEAEIRRAHMVDLARGTAKFFPWVPYQREKAGQL